MKNLQLKISNVTIQPGERITLALPTPELYTFAPIYIPIHVIHGRKAGPTLLICGSMHGDEINGVAITQKLLNLRLLNSVRGTLIVVPTINVYGMMTLSRNLPDRRDLEGSFPGSKTGSFASRLACFLTEEVFSHITHAIDLHTGESHISKFPQVKAFMGDEDCCALAEAFQAPVIVDTDSNQGLLWLRTYEKKPVPTIIFEAGEGFRLDSQSVKTGVRGIVRVMRSLGMLKQTVKESRQTPSVCIHTDQWIRAGSSGLCEIFHKIGAFVKKGDKLARITDPFGTEQREEMFSPLDAVVVGKSNLPILNEGEPVLQLSEIKKSEVETIQNWEDYQNDKGAETFE